MAEPLDISPDQWVGVRFLASRNVAGLFDRPGFGKSAQFVRAADLQKRDAITVLCPPSPVTLNEATEFEKWSLLGLPVTIIRTSKDEIPKHGVRICNFALAGRPDVAKKLAKAGCGALILDEAHHVKNPQGSRTKAIFRAKGIASTADRVWFVTGTPTPNHAGEYYVFAKVAGAWGGTYNQFLERYCILAESHYGIKPIGTKPDMLAELKAMIGAHALARDAIEDGRGALTVDVAHIEGAAPDYSAIEPEHLEAIKAAIDSGNWATLDGDAVATVRRITGQAKAKGTAELAKAALDAGHRQVLIFADHTAVIDEMANSLAEYKTAIIDGRASQALRERVRFDFGPENLDNTPLYRVCIAQRQALKEGVTMIGATRVLLAEPFWTPEDNSQMIARAARRGQKLPVHASFVHLPGSMDEKIIRVNARKIADIERIKIKTPPNSELA